MKHGQNTRNIDIQLISEEGTFLWLLNGDLKADSESEIVATKILNTETDSKCRLWQQCDETIDHIISACPILVKEQYTKRHEECVPNYTSTYARKQGYNWTKNTGMNMYQNQ